MEVSVSALRGEHQVLMEKLSVELDLFDMIM